MAKIKIKTRTEKDVLVEYQEMYRFGNADLMDLLGVSRQQAWNYLTGKQAPSTDRLFKVAREKAGEWESRMALAMLAVRGIDVHGMIDAQEKVTA